MCSVHRTILFYINKLKPEVELLSVVCTKPKAVEMRDPMLKLKDANGLIGPDEDLHRIETEKKILTMYLCRFSYRQKNP